MHTVKTKKKFESYFKLFFLFALAVFGVTLYFISTDLTYLTDGVITHHFHIDSPSDGFMKTIQLVNNFDHEISVHYDDGETGLYLSNLDPGEKVTISASLGQGLYATDPNGWERLDFVSIRSDIKEYIFSPHEKNALIFRQLNIGHQSRPHPLVVNLHFPVPALSTRFKYVYIC